MFSGIFGKTKAIITRYYAQNEDEFTSKKIVERRFSETMDKIESVFGDEIVNTVFRKKTLFFTLFGVFYDLLFDLRVHLPKSKGAKTRTLPANLKASLLKIDKNLSEATVPKNVLDASARRTTHKASREVLHKYCIKIIGA